LNPRQRKIQRNHAPEIVLLDASFVWRPVGWDVGNLASPEIKLATWRVVAIFSGSFYER
jgi:hypothetical protein